MIGILNEIGDIQKVAHDLAYFGAVIHGDAAFLIDEKTQHPSG